jgi:hypothetical protein
MYRDAGCREGVSLDVSSGSNNEKYFMGTEDNFFRQRKTWAL